MAHMSRRFNFDDFDALCAEALDEHRKTDAQMAAEDLAYDEEQAWADHDRVFLPGEIGGVICRPTFGLTPDSSPDPLPDPPAAA